VWSAAVLIMFHCLSYRERSVLWFQLLFGGICNTSDSDADCNW